MSLKGPDNGSTLVVDYDTRLAELEKFGLTRFNNTQMAARLGGGVSIERTAGMSPEQYYEVYGPNKKQAEKAAQDDLSPETPEGAPTDPLSYGSIALNLAKQLGPVPEVKNDFTYAADSTSPDLTPKPRFI